MKLQKIGNLCRKTKQAYLYKHPNGSQWISAGHGIYLVESMPPLDAEATLALFDIPPQDKASWKVFEEATFTLFDTSSVTEADIPCEFADVDIVVKSRTLRRIHTATEDMFIDVAYLKPMEDSKESQHFVRHRRDGKPYVVAARGFLVNAVLLPVANFDETVASQIKDIAKAVKTLVDKSDAEGAQETLFKDKEGASE